jgi:predicted dehydrogenase
VSEQEIRTKEKKIRVGIVGLQPNRGWAAVAHLPALRRLSNEFEIAGVANSTFRSAQDAAEKCGIARAFANVAEMVASPDVDLVVVTVKVPAHLQIVRTLIQGGKDVFCEWPIGRNLGEAEELVALAREHGVRAFTSTQSRVSPAMLHMKRLVDEGFVGSVLSSTVSGWGRIWGPTIEDLKSDGYLLDNSNGASLLTIPFAHTLAAVRDVLGDVAELSSVLATRRPQVLAIESGKLVPMDVADQIVVAATLASGAPLSMHFRGGEPTGVDGFVWDIQGTDGDLRMTGPTGHTQIVPLTIVGGRKDEHKLLPIAIPDDGIALQDNVPGNIARVYRCLATDFNEGTQTAPTFADALELHRLLDQIEMAGRDGRRVSPKAPNRVLPSTCAT